MLLFRDAINRRLYKRNVFHKRPYSPITSNLVETRLTSSNYHFIVSPMVHRVMLLLRYRVLFRIANADIHVSQIANSGERGAFQQVGTSVVKERQQLPVDYAGRL